MIYIASPYSHPERKVVEERYRLTRAFAAHLCRDGLTVFSSIVHWHNIAKVYKLPKDYAFWKKHDERYLHRCTALYVLCLPGWKESVGVQEEIKYFKTKRPQRGVYYFYPRLSGISKRVLRWEESTTTG